MSAFRSPRMKLTAFLAACALAGTSSVAVADDQAPNVDPAVVVEEQQLLDDEASTVEPTPSADAEESEQAVVEEEQTATDEAPIGTLGSDPLFQSSGRSAPEIGPEG